MKKKGRSIPTDSTKSPKLRWVPTVTVALKCCSLFWKSKLARWMLKCPTMPFKVEPAFQCGAHLLTSPTTFFTPTNCWTFFFFFFRKTTYPLSRHASHCDNHTTSAWLKMICWPFLHFTCMGEEFGSTKVDDKDFFCEINWKAISK